MSNAWARRRSRLRNFLCSKDTHSARYIRQMRCPSSNTCRLGSAGKVKVSKLQRPLKTMMRTKMKKKMILIRADCKKFPKANTCTNNKPTIYLKTLKLICQLLKLIWPKNHLSCRKSKPQGRARPWKSLWKRHSLWRNPSRFKQGISCGRFLHKSSKTWSRRTRKAKREPRMTQCMKTKNLRKWKWT